MENFVVEVLRYIKNPNNLSTTLSVLITLILFFLKIPQKIIKFVFDMIFNIIIEYKSNKISKKFLEWIVSESMKYSSDELRIIRNDLRKIYNLSWTKYIFPNTVAKIKNSVFEKLGSNLSRIGDNEYIFSKYDNGHLFIRENKNATP